MAFYVIYDSEDDNRPVSMGTVVDSTAVTANGWSVATFDNPPAKGTVWNGDTLDFVAVPPVTLVSIRQDIINKFVERYPNALAKLTVAERQFLGQVLDQLLAYLKRQYREEREPTGLEGL